MHTLGQKIRIVRQLKGYSQEYMALQLGISQNAYSKLERGMIRLRTDRLSNIATLLEIPLYNLATLEERHLLNEAPGTRKRKMPEIIYLD
jgi:transcriptional regulator with XRE-family HTH domain